MIQVWLSAAGLCGATIIGALIGFGIKELPHKWNDTVMGFCAGVMLAASIIGLILPAAEQAGSGLWWVVAIGVMAGAMFLNILDLVVFDLKENLLGACPFCLIFVLHNTVPFFMLLYP